MIISRHELPQCDPMPAHCQPSASQYFISRIDMPSALDEATGAGSCITSGAIPGSTLDSASQTTADPSTLRKPRLFIRHWEYHRAAHGHLVQRSGVTRQDRKGFERPHMWSVSVSPATSAWVHFLPPVRFPIGRVPTHARMVLGSVATSFAIAATFFPRRASLIASRLRLR